MKIGIIGNGFVGKATRLLECNKIEVLTYDIKPELCIPPNLKLIDLLECEIIFISVPTPMQKNGECYLNIVESVLNDLNEINYKNYVILRSTVPVGTANRLNCYFMPEFLTEQNYENDFINNNEWIFGLLDDNDDFKNKIMKLIHIAYTNNRIKYFKTTFLSNNEAEMVKLFRNCFLATKVSFCNEIYEYCSLKNINYDKMIDIACNDRRITHSHINVPGSDGVFGFGGTCFPKDISNLYFQMEKEGMKSYILKNVIERNNNKDRLQKDWENKIGRSII
tara:strand:- start:293 stop:1129 length:837 start_codon:yes stop_codon:yes gene_type:complete